ncbi:MAG: 16S rRNA processing protein RimM [Gemmatimonadaceae bacterium]|nr:16S rRNA processing protein RimM [Gemmatimonadaceae bacterium]
MTIGPTAVVGRVRRAHGIKGELVVALETDAPDAIFAPGARVIVGTQDGDLAPDRRTGRLVELVVRAARDFQDGLLVFFEGIADRTAAEKWRGVTLLVPMDELEPPADDELWVHELPGMRAVDPHGELLGEVRGSYELPQGLVLEIATARGLRDVPFNDAFVVDFDRDTRVITLDVPEGLLE